MVPWDAEHARVVTGLECSRKVLPAEACSKMMHGEWNDMLCHKDWTCNVLGGAALSFTKIQTCSSPKHSRSIYTFMSSKRWPHDICWILAPSSWEVDQSLMRAGVCQASRHGLHVSFQCCLLLNFVCVALIACMCHLFLHPSSSNHMRPIQSGADLSGSLDFWMSTTCARCVLRILDAALVKRVHGEVYANGH